MMVSNDPHFEPWTESDPEAWSPSPAGTVIGLAASFLLSATAWVLVLRVAAELLG